MKRIFYIISIVIFGLISQSRVYAQPQLESPANGSTLSTLKVTLQWQSVSNATDYELQIATDNGFQNMLDDEMTSGATSETLYFNDGQTYYWRVAAYYADETNSGFSSYNYFTISATPIISDYKYCEYPIKSFFMCKNIEGHLGRQLIRDVVV
jgi:hypothetical protein